jgi:peptidoglycan/xylan/chitin deacetylase (PgdA/CDA1 family)
MELKPFSHSPKILVFHKLTSKLSFGSTNYSPPRFSRLLAFLQRQGYIFQSLETVLSEYNPQAVAITFDDGYYHLADVLPLLMDKYRFQPVIFVPTRFLGKPNSWDYSHPFRSTPHLDARRIKDLANLGVEFGSHGHSHVNLCRCDDKTLRHELEHSKALLEDILSRNVDYISYPFGRYNQRVLEAVREAGYTRGFTMSFPEGGDTAFIIGRYAIYGFDSCRSVLRKFRRSGPLYNVERWKARLTNKLSGGPVIFDRLIRRERR